MRRQWNERLASVVWGRESSAGCTWMTASTVYQQWAWCRQFHRHSQFGMHYSSLRWWTRWDRSHWTVAAWPSPSLPFDFLYCSTLINSQPWALAILAAFWATLVVSGSTLCVEQCLPPWHYALHRRWGRLGQWWPQQVQSANARFCCWLGTVCQNQIAATQSTHWGWPLPAPIIKLYWCWG